MSGQADVKSIDTLAFVKVALVSFIHETGQAIAEIELEGRRGVDWITVDRAAHWKAESRRAADLVNQSIKDLEHCRTFKKVGDSRPACIDEKKALDKARARLAYAEKKAEAVRRWTLWSSSSFVKRASDSFTSENSSIVTVRKPSPGWNECFSPLMPTERFPRPDPLPAQAPPAQVHR